MPSHRSQAFPAASGAEDGCLPQRPGTSAARRLHGDSCLGRLRRSGRFSAGGTWPGPRGRPSICESNRSASPERRTIPSAQSAWARASLRLTGAFRPRQTAGLRRQAQRAAGAPQLSTGAKRLGPLPPRLHLGLSAQALLHRRFAPKTGPATATLNSNFNLFRFTSRSSNRKARRFFSPARRHRC